MSPLPSTSPTPVLQLQSFDPSLSAHPLALSIPSLPIEEPVIVFALALTTFLIAPMLIERAGLPGIVGIVLVGAMLGPNGTGVLAETDAIVLLGNVGLVYLLFTVGLELDLRGFAAAPENAALFGLTSFFLPFVIGSAVGISVLGLDPWASFLLAAVFSSHTLLAYPVVNRLDVTKNRAVTAVFGGILFTDTLALVVLAIVLGAVEGELTALLFGQVFASIAVLFAGVWFVLPPIARWFFRNTSQESYFEFLLVAAAIFGAASFAEVLGLSDILGAFVAGIALNRLVTRGGPLMNRIEFVGNALFVPFFLLYVGMLVDPGVILDGPRTLFVAGVIVATMLVTKVAAAGIVSAIQGYDREEFGVITGLSVGQAAAALAITLVGYDAGLFGADVLNAVVLMMLVAAVLSPWLTERYGTRLALGGDVEPGEAGEFDPRVLLPLSMNAERQRPLLELVFTLKDELAESPVHLLTVVQPDGSGDDDDAVAEAEAGLAEASEIADAAEVPVRSETRVNHSIASGIVRASTETRAELIVMGWDAERSLSNRAFGSIIDQVLGRTTVPVLVSRLGHPLNTTERIFVVTPPGVDHHEGFYESVHVVKRLAEKLGAELHVYVVGDNPRQYERLFGMVDPEIEGTFEGVADWEALDGTLRGRTEANDLVMPVSPRQGNVGWDPELARLPRRLADLPPHSFIVVTPRREEPGYAARFLKIE
ncbi:cation:proton antiporter [Halorubrum sp. JWXQ-INN 858]|uniref:cation:proton antiporter n=1 Tax=Halorubrum sp. JWXQ-INN 858 TaxID=2690782 RepID=UPI00135C7145|nr:cation:proton antiporter [Halorubrum sp. JWXQ-INN 858]MWV66047.1 cation:proton antiporter [Halorubrum sp. JWXQ-INN 858]